MATTTVFYNGVRPIEFEVTDAKGNLRVLTINGSGFGLQGANAMPLPMAGAYGITKNVDADLWAAVEKKYGDMAIFKEGFIRAGASEKAKDAAKETVSAKDNGQAPISQSEDVSKKTRKKK